MDAETLYHAFRDAAESAGATIGDDADDLLGQAASAIASNTEDALSITGDSYDRYSMYSPAGNRVVREWVNRLTDEIRAESFPRKGLDSAYEKTLHSIVEAGHPEVHDTEPRQQIIHEINEACAKVGWVGLEQW